MPSLMRSACLASPPVLSLTRRTAVYGPVRTVVWEGRAGNRSPYPDPSCATGVPPVPEHGQDGRGTSLVAAPPRCASVSLWLVHSIFLSLRTTFCRPCRA